MLRAENPMNIKQVSDAKMGSLVYGGKIDLQVHFFQYNMERATELCVMSCGYTRSGSISQARMMVVIPTSSVTF